MDRRNHAPEKRVLQERRAGTEKRGRTNERNAARDERGAADRRGMERDTRDTAADGVIEGRNAIAEALRAGVSLDKVYVQKGETDRTLARLAAKARAAGAVVVDADRHKLDAMSVTRAHQGIIALAAVREYAEPETLFQRAAERGEAPLFAVCDEITDPHNFGAILRGAECAGVHGVVVPKRRSAGLTAITAKTSAGAVAHIPVARVPNLTALLKEWKKRGVCIYGADPAGTTPIYAADFRGPAAIVIGSEGDGISRLVREQCDVLVQIPMRGKVNSLNASAAAAILFYEAVRQRTFTQTPEADSDRQTPDADSSRQAEDTEGGGDQIVD